MKILILFFGLVVSNLSFGAAWMFVAESSDLDKDYYVDTESYKYNKENAKAILWYKRNVFSGLKEYTDTKTLIEYDCNNKKERYLAQSRYDIDGNSLSQTNTPSTTMHIIPDTLGESLWEVACKTKGVVYDPNKVNYVNMERIKRNQKSFEPEEVPETMIHKNN